MGGSLAAQILAAGVGGWFLDRWLGTGPWLLITLLVLGVGVSMTQFIREALRETSADRNKPSLPRDRKKSDS
jgi:ATP synthase protein I